MKKDDVLKKQIKVLYIILFVLIFITIGGFVYMEYRISSLNDRIDINSQLAMYTAKKLNATVTLNKLDTDQCKYIINSSNWKELLSKYADGLVVNIPDNWSLNEVEIFKCEIPEGSEPNYEFTILLNMDGEVTFNDFVSDMYNQIKNLDYNDIVQSFNKDKGGYYEINSFDEATYSNMYYDVVTTNEDGVLEGPRHKVKILNMEDNIVKIEVDIF